MPFEAPADQPVAAHEVPQFLKKHIEGILAQYACYMQEVIEHPKLHGVSATAARSLAELQQRTMHFIDMVCDTIASSTEAGKLLHKSLGQILGKIDLYKTMRAAISGALQQAPTSRTIDYASSCILPPSIQLPLNLTVIKPSNVDLVSYSSLRPGSLVCVSRGSTPSWTLNNVCMAYQQNKETQFTLSSEPLQHRLCVVTRIWIENSISPEDTEAFLMTTHVRRRKNPFMLEPGTESLENIREEDVLGMYSSDGLVSEPVSKLDSILAGRREADSDIDLELGENANMLTSDIEGALPGDIQERIRSQARDIPQKIVRNDKYTRTQMDRSSLRLLLRFRLELLDIHESEAPPEDVSDDSDVSLYAPLSFIKDINPGVHSMMPWLAKPLRLSYGTRYVVDASTVTFADLGILLDPFVDQMVFCPASNTYCLAYNKLQKRFRMVYVHDGPTRENRFHARVSWIKAKKQLPRDGNNRLVTVQIETLDSVHLSDVEGWLEKNTVYDCACCSAQTQSDKLPRPKSKPARGDTKGTKGVGGHLTTLIFARFLAPLPGSTRFLEIMYEDIFPTVAVLKKPKRKFYSNVMRLCLEFIE